MSIYIYSPKLYEGTRELIQALGAKRILKHDGYHFLYKGVPVSLGPGDTVICFGGFIPKIDGVTVINHRTNCRNDIDLAINSRSFGSFTSAMLVYPERMSNYNEVLQVLEANNWKIGKKGSKSYFSRMPCKDLPGYGLPNTGNAHQSIFVIGNEVIPETGDRLLWLDPSDCLAIAKEAGLQACKIRISRYNDYNYLTKIRSGFNIPADKLDAVCSAYRKLISEEHKSTEIKEELNALLA